MRNEAPTTDRDDTDSGRGSLTPEELDRFPAAPGERLLRALATDPNKPRTREDLVEHTDLDSNTITKALERLAAQSLVDDRGGRYFIPESRQSTVDGLLTDTHQLRASATESTQDCNISEIDPRNPDAHILTLIYTNTACSYSAGEIHAGLDDDLAFTRDTIEKRSLDCPLRASFRKLLLGIITRSRIVTT